MKAILDLPKIEGNIRVGARSSWERSDLLMEDLPGLLMCHWWAFFGKKVQ